MTINQSIKWVYNLVVCLALGGGTISALVSTSAVAEAKNPRLAGLLDKKMMESKYGLFGVRLSSNFATISVTREKNDPFIKDSSSGANVGLGVIFDKAFNRLVGVRGEALFQRKSFSAEAVPNYDLTKPERLDTRTTLNFVEVPIMAVVRFMDGNFIRPYAAAGVYGSMLLYADGEQEDEGTLDEPRRPFTTFDYGLVFAGGSYFVLAEGFGFLSAELRYSRGLANLADEDVETTSTEKNNGGSKFSDTPLNRQTYNIHNVSLMVGYYF